MPAETHASRSGLAVGIAAALTAAVIGAGWQLTTRYGVTTTLGPLELALLRYSVPAIILLPLWLRIGLRPRNLTWWRLAVLVCGGGLPFGLLVLAGAQFAPAAHIGVFVAGTMPVFTALAQTLTGGGRIAPLRWTGFALVFAGAAWLGLGSIGSSDGAWRGDLLFLLASLGWAAYTLAFRGSGLTPWHGVALVNGWSAIGAGAIALVWGVPRLATAPLADVALQAAGQGLAAGLLGLVAYMVAVSRLGGATASLSGALVPPMTAVGAAWVLNEPLGGRIGLASILVGLGIALASGALNSQRKQEDEAENAM